MNEIDAAPAVPVPSPTTNPTQQIALRKEWFSLTSPIGLIGAFTAIVDVALILAAILIGDRDARFLLILFAAAAFFYVTTWAFHLLKFQPEVLYGPHQYAGGTTAAVYAEAVNRDRFLAHRARATTVDATVLTTTLTSDSIAGGVQSPVVETKQREAPQSASIEVFEEGEYLTLIVEDEHRKTPYFPSDDSLKRGPETKTIRYDPTQWVGMFIVKASEEYSALGYYATPESYGLTWMMRDRKTGVTLDDIGFIYEFGLGVASVDRRRLFETGVLPGMELEPVQLPPPSFPATTPDPFNQFLAKEGLIDKMGRRRPRSTGSPPATAPPGLNS